MPYVKRDRSKTLFERRKGAAASFPLALTFGVGLAACQPGGIALDSEGNPILAGGQLHGDSLPNKTVVFTYDDGPDEHTLELAKYLNSEGIKATFFINGSRICRSVAADGSCMTPPETKACNNGQMQAPVTSPKFYPESLLDQVVALGHRLGNHTQDHCHLQGQSNAADLAWELSTTQAILDRHICDGVTVFRAPFGEWDDATARRLNSQMGFEKYVGPVNWEIDGNDWACWRNKATPEQCATQYMNILTGRAKQNGIFLMHDRPEFNVGYEGPLLMTKVLVPRLKQMGYKFATLDEALKLSPKDGGAACQPPPNNSGGSDAGTGGAGDAGTSADAAKDGGSGGAGGSSGGSGGAGGASETGGSSGSGSGGAGGSGGSASGSGGSAGGSGGSSSGGSGGRSGTGGRESTPPPVTTSGDNGGGCSVSPGGANAGAPGFAGLVILGGLLARVRRRRQRA
jgi:MYXO-CTERM domain-containing protein